jgi:hypothetical protein
MPLQEALEELVAIKVVVSSLEEEVVLARSQRTKSDRWCAGEWPSISSLGSLVGFCLIIGFVCEQSHS